MRSYKKSRSTISIRWGRESYMDIWRFFFFEESFDREGGETSFLAVTSGEEKEENQRNCS